MIRTRAHGRFLWVPGLVVLLLVLVGAGSARADEAEGRRRWKRGQELYEKGRFLDAAREFEAGFRAAPRPLFLLNIGHAYRRANELAKAKDAYRRYLDFGSNLPQSDEVEGHLKSIDDALAAAAPAEPSRPAAGAPQPPPPAPPPPAPRLTLADPSSLPPPKPAPNLGPEPEPAPHPVIADTRTAEDPGDDSVFRKPWFWVVIGAVVAGGVTAAIIATRPDNSCPATVCFKE